MGLGDTLGLLLELSGPLLGLLGGDLGSSSGALEDVFWLRNHVFKYVVSQRREHDFQNLYEQEREASL